MKNNIEIDVSIIVPVYNSELYLESCISSIVNQTFSNFEVILINDGSTDKSQEIIDTFLESDRRIRSVTQKNLGVSAARNTGIKFSVGKYILFVDSDDTLEKGHVSEMYSLISSREFDLGISGYFFVVNGMKNKVFPIRNNRVLNSQQVINEMLKYDGIQGYPFNKIFKNEIIKKNELLFSTNISIAEDLLFCVQYCKHITYAEYKPIATYNYVMNKTSALNSRKINKFNLNNLTHIDALKKVEKLISPDNIVGRNRVKAAKTYACSLYFRLTFDDENIQDNIKIMLKKKAKNGIKELLVSDYGGIRMKLSVIVSVFFPKLAIMLQKK